MTDYGPALSRLQDERAADFAKWFKIIGYEGLTEYQAECPQVIDAAMRELALYRWMGDMRLNLNENSVVGMPKWYVVDIDGDVLGSADTRREALAAAHRMVTNA